MCIICQKSGLLTVDNKRSVLGEVNLQTSIEVAVCVHGNLTEYENMWKMAKREICRGLYSWGMQFLNYSTSRNTFSPTLWQLSCQQWCSTSLRFLDLEVKALELLPLQSVVYLSELNKGYCICSFTLPPPATERRLRGEMLPWSLTEP